jgi:hypothetical protein
MKHKIEVRIRRTYNNPGNIIGTIKRKLYAEQMGNFNPIFCSYHGKKHLVLSMNGDLSDPFRRDESYLKTLYIEI